MLQREVSGVFEAFACEEETSTSGNLDSEWDFSTADHDIEIKSLLLKEEPQIAQKIPSSPMAALQANTSIIPETPALMKTDVRFERSSVGSGAHAPKVSEDSSLTLSKKDGDLTAQRKPHFRGLEDIDEGALSEDMMSVAEPIDEDRPTLPWILQTILLIWGWLLRQWHGFWTTTDRQRGEQPETSDQSGSKPQEKNGDDGEVPRGGKRQREPIDSVDGANREEPSAGQLKRARLPKKPRNSRPFACPFCKKDLQWYQACVRFELTKVRHVKQHLHRKHADEIDDSARALLRQRSAPGTEEEQWYRIFDLLFPGHSPRPASPYNDFTVSERPSQASPEGVPVDKALHDQGLFFTKASIEILYQSLVEDPVFSSIKADDIREALNRGLSRACPDQRLRQSGLYTSQQTGTQQGSERANTDSDQISNGKSSGQLRDPSTSSSSGGCEFTDKRSRSVTVNLGPTPDLDRRRHDVDYSSGWEGLLRDLDLPAEEALYNRQLGFDGEPGVADGLRMDPTSAEGVPPLASEWEDNFDMDWLLSATIGDDELALNCDQ